VISSVHFARYRTGRKNGYAVAAAVRPCRRKSSRAAAFPSGDLPEAPGGAGFWSGCRAGPVFGQVAGRGRFLVRLMSRRPEPVWNGAGKIIFRHRPLGAALHREAK
jgi:hypothetical protein